MSGGVQVSPADDTDRDDAAAFAGRVSRWDPLGPVRLRTDGTLLRLWATTPFDALVTRAVTGAVAPRDATVHAGNLAAALAVGRGEAIDVGPAVDALWRTQLPPPHPFVPVDEIPAAVLQEQADQGTDAARARPGPAGGAPTALLDAVALTVSGNGMRVDLPMRVLFALSGMGFAPPVPDEVVRVSATDAWLRLDARFGAVLRRRHALLPLVF